MTTPKYTRSDMNIIRREVDSVEFFTLEATGESGMSQSGLAILCGVTEGAIRKLLKSVRTKSVVESLKPLQEKDFYFVPNSEYKNANIIADWACGCVLEYYAMDAEQTREKAKTALRRFRDSGIRIGIQKITGWQQNSQRDQKKLYSEWRDYEKFRFQSDTNRVRLRNQLKQYRNELNASINDYYKAINKVASRKEYAAVADAINVALTGETSGDMKRRTNLDGSKLIADYMPETALAWYSTTVTVTTNLILSDKIEPLRAVAKAPTIALPKTYKPEIIEFIDPLVAAERRIDMYLSGQLSLPWVR